MAEHRPNSVTDEMLDYLDVLRLTGMTNMFGAVPYLMDEFDLSQTEAKTVLMYWMDTFGERNR